MLTTEKEELLAKFDILELSITDLENICTQEIPMHGIAALKLHMHTEILRLTANSIRMSINAFEETQKPRRRRAGREERLES